ncbi:MAG: hypothetical protein H8F28_22115 [Fibrella sp.]|nr:hypothetical protein [Armatimonadota bacterium]
MTESGESELPVAQNLIRLLHIDETSENSSDASQTAERVFEAMRVRLSTVLGAGGYSTLLARSLALTRPKFPWLVDVVSDKHGSLVGRLGVVSQTAPPSEIVRGFTALFTRFGALMTTFVGADLTNRLLESVWQDLEENTTDLVTRGEKNL